MLDRQQTRSRHRNKIEDRTSQKLFCTTQKAPLRLTNQSRPAFKTLKMLCMVYSLVRSRNMDPKNTNNQQTRSFRDVDISQNSQNTMDIAYHERRSLAQDWNRTRTIQTCKSP
ncbi:hypothetical protein HHI36_006056 [Cryptolaemus montrouzieri]|uniref:Uncharacterized protein n=1 Tax=Cryptolaemus montrouzieri TaxID=559131 RepID=A0ABD2NVV7_9CUCU